jgi:hypothetical protein
MVWQVPMGPGVRTGLDCRPADLAIRVRAYDLAQKAHEAHEAQGVGKVVQVGAGTWLISLELATP